MEIKTDTKVTIILNMDETIALARILYEAASTKNKTWNARYVEDCVLNDLQCSLSEVLK